MIEIPGVTGIQEACSQIAERAGLLLIGEAREEKLKEGGLSLPIAVDVVTEAAKAVQLTAAKVLEHLRGGGKPMEPVLMIYARHGMWAVEMAADHTQDAIARGIVAVTMEELSELESAVGDMIVTVRELDVELHSPESLTWLAEGVRTGDYAALHITVGPTIANPWWLDGIMNEVATAVAISQPGEVQALSQKLRGDA